VQKLAQLAKRTSMFDDPELQIAELTLLIKQDIQGLNASISDLQNLSHQSWGEGNRQSSVHNEKVVDSLRSRLKDTTLQFKEVLTVRSDNLKANQDRRSIFSSDPKTTGESEPQVVTSCHRESWAGPAGQPG
jgi:syntaxin 5